MSLFALPVSVSDLTQLQFGIEFFTNPTEATTEAGLINQNDATETVNSYAFRLLANNISLSQVAMAVDSLMFGITDNVTELGKLSTQFLPAQVAAAVASGLNPTVYAAEALGLALTGGNGSSNAFASSFGSLSVAEFVSETADLTGINAGAIQGFVQSWISFYTANPSATFDLSVTLAAYGAAFGDAVGAALLNPTVNGTLALLTSEVQDALIDNSEGLYRPNINLISELPHTPLEGEAIQIGQGTFDWAKIEVPIGVGDTYAQLFGPQTGDIIINNAQSTFTLNVGHHGDGHYTVQINPAGGSGDLFTLILGGGTSPGVDASLGKVFADGYSNVDIVAVGNAGVTFMTDGIEITGNLIISGGGTVLELGDISPFSVIAQTITVTGAELTLGTAHTEKIDASNGVLFMGAPVDSPMTTGVTVLGSDDTFNIFQGSLGPLSAVAFTNGSTGIVADTYVGSDNITTGDGGIDTIYGDGGPDSITLPQDHMRPDKVVFGEDLLISGNARTHDVLAITDGTDKAYLGSWGAGTTPTAIPTLFSDAPSGGTSTDMTVITGFHTGERSGSSGGDELDFTVAAWDGASAVATSLGFVSSPKGDLVALNGLSVVPVEPAQLSAVWANSGSNISLNTTDNVLRYAPSDASLQNAQQLAAQLHTSSDALLLPGGGLIPAGNNKHMLVAYDASSNVNGIIQHAVNIADVDLVNTSGENQSSTANLNVYASDMVHLVGMSLSSLVPDNMHFV